MPGFGPRRASHASALEPAGGGGDWSPTLPLTLPLALAQTFFRCPVTALAPSSTSVPQLLAAPPLHPSAIPAAPTRPQHPPSGPVGLRGRVGGWMEATAMFHAFQCAGQQHALWAGSPWWSQGHQCISRPVVHITHSQWQLAPCSQPTLLRYPFLHTICLAKHRPWPH